MSAEVAALAPPAFDIEGRNNADWDQTVKRIYEGASYKDQSVVCVLPTRDGKIHVKVEDALDGLIRPMNHPFIRLNLNGFEVGDAYNTAVQQILAHPVLSKFKFLLTVESDNIPPPDGLTKLLKAMYSSPYAAISGLYWTKGEGSMPMIYGDPKEFPVNFRPQLPLTDTLQECRGIAMGFGLWDLELFRDPNLKHPWFETKQDFDPSTGVAVVGTQDLVFCGKAVALGYRFAVHTGVKVGHMDLNSGVVW